MAIERLVECAAPKRGQEIAQGRLHQSRIRVPKAEIDGLGDLSVTDEANAQVTGQKFKSQLRTALAPSSVVDGVGREDHRNGTGRCGGVDKALYQGHARFSTLEG